MKEIESIYLGKLFTINRKNKFVQKAVDILNKIDKKRDYTLVGRGISGTSLLPLLSYLSGVNYTIIRKPDESTHSTSTIEGYTRFKKYIIVDDFISTGSTIENIISSINEWKTNKELEGVILYRESERVSHNAKKFNCWIRKV